MANVSPAGHGLVHVLERARWQPRTEQGHGEQAAADGADTPQRLDYFVASKSLMDKSKTPHVHDTWIAEDPPAEVSDHGPIFCDIAL